MARINQHDIPEKMLVTREVVVGTIEINPYSEEGPTVGEAAFALIGRDCDTGTYRFTLPDTTCTVTVDVKVSADTETGFKYGQ